MSSLSSSLPVSSLSPQSRPTRPPAELSGLIINMNYTDLLEPTYIAFISHGRFLQQPATIGGTGDKSGNRIYGQNEKIATIYGILQTTFVFFLSLQIFLL